MKIATLLALLISILLPLAARAQGDDTVLYDVDGTKYSITEVRLEQPLEPIPSVPILHGGDLGTTTTPPSFHYLAPPADKRGKFERVVDYIHDTAEAHPKVVTVAKWTGGLLLWTLNVAAAVGNVIRW